jgi:riboflavin kinase/FMN adenylyltransferase
VNIGHQPTFGSEANRLEVHMMGLKDEDLYGELVEVKWLRRVRETRKFDSIEDLIRQIGKDLELCRIIASPELLS